MCLISDCQRRSRCKARDALLGCPPSLLVEPSKGGKGESVVAEKLGSIEIKNPGEIVLCYVIGAIVPRDPPSSPSPSVLSLFRLCRGKTDLEHSLSPFSLRLSFSLSLSLSLFDGVHPRVHCYSGDRVEHRCFISFDDTHLAIESPMRRAMGIISNRIVTVIFSFLSLFSIGIYLFITVYYEFSFFLSP